MEIEQTFEVHQFGIRLNGQFGVTGVLSGLKREDAKKRLRPYNPDSRDCMFVKVYNEYTGRQVYSL